jgi:hypothetical protein
MPISRKKIPKSSSDGAVSSMADSSGGRFTRIVPRSKTFGSKLKVPSKKAIKAAQLAKVQQQ